jgi:hypothetical protein
MEGHGACLRLLQASASLRQKPGLYLVVNLEQLQQTQQLGEHTLLPGRMQALFVEMDKTFLIRVDEELILKQIVSPLINCHNNCKIPFLISRKA